MEDRWITEKGAASFVQVEIGLFSRILRGDVENLERGTRRR